MKIFLSVDKTGGFSLDQHALIGFHSYILQASARIRMMGGTHIKWSYFYDKNAIKAGEIKKETKRVKKGKA